MSILTSRDLLLLPQATPTVAPRVTSTHMPAALCEKLIQLCNQYQQIIADNGNSMDCRIKRKTIWLKIAKELNGDFGVEFTPDQYKKKYQNLKTALKTKILHLRSSPDIRRETSVQSVPTAQAMEGESTNPMRLSPSPEDKKNVQLQKIPTPQLGSQLAVESLLVKLFDNNHDHVSEGAHHAGASSATASETPIASNISESTTTSAGALLCDEDPTRLFCLSLADPLGKIRLLNPARYVHLKRTITNLVFDAELESLDPSKAPRSSPS